VNLQEKICPWPIVYYIYVFLF